MLSICEQYASGMSGSCVALNDHLEFLVIPVSMGAVKHRFGRRKEEHE